ncbi:hypothetical protein M501DRAFT_998073 [Patellaria atrata CBS 101060]|uniref:Uncharacterized protein n=1 Tax=Patellaria atrata CBS 101060 TaxID=1346257 RepID=A0A9P4SG30_9PEZI|nr:hypothetical protein M501DRAFT_998073 [Patellaria atrata CBS 101060]
MGQQQLFMLFQRVFGTRLLFSFSGLFLIERGLLSFNCEPDGFIERGRLAYDNVICLLFAKLGYSVLGLLYGVRYLCDYG